MYKRIILTAAAIFAAASIGASSAFAAEDCTVQLAEQSCSMSVSFDKNGDTYNSQSKFTASKDMKMILVSDKKAVKVQVTDNAGNIKAEKNALDGCLMLNVKAGETYSVNIVAADDKVNASVYVYGI